MRSSSRFSATPLTASPILADVTAFMKAHSACARGPLQPAPDCVDERAATLFNRAVIASIIDVLGRLSALGGAHLDIAAVQLVMADDVAAIVDAPFAIGPPGDVAAIDHGVTFENVAAGVLAGVVVLDTQAAVIGQVIGDMPVDRTHQGDTVERAVGERVEHQNIPGP